MKSSKATNTQRKIAVSKYMLMGAIFSTCGATTAFASTEGVAKTDRVYVQTSDNATIMLLNQGDSIQVTGKRGELYQISTGGIDNLYVGAEYIDLLGEADFPDLDELDRLAAEAAAAAEAEAIAAALAAIEAEAAEEAAKEAPAEVAAEALEAPIEEYEVEKVSEASEAQASSEIYGVVASSNGLNFRTGASQSASVITALENGYAVDIISVGDEWTKVSVDGKTGYMATEFLTIKQGKKPAQSAAPASSKGDKFVSYAKQFLGTPYVWGGTNLNRGVDCSGFVYSVYRHFGITLNRSSSSMVSNGYRVKKADLQKGDLVFFDTSGANNGVISHVGMYIGNGQIIHSASGKVRGVSISSLNEAYYSRTYVTAVRVL
ncbi:MAG: C40 family peptidase [Clostridiales bacterium]|jgi:cell wall-associated NlpC family hydrolase|nr:C40 family peptidase [Clostridiales bacterium]